MNIEIAYWVLFAIISVIAILGITRKLNIGIALAGIVLGLIVAWLLAPYMEIVIYPVGQALFYGGSWSIPALLGLIHLATMIIIVGEAGYNLSISGGKIVWA